MRPVGDPTVRRDALSHADDATQSASESVKKCVNERALRKQRFPTINISCTRTEVDDRFYLRVQSVVTVRAKKKAASRSSPLLLTNCV
jgi:hypothetical protein